MVFLKLAVPGAGMICLEWWCFELMTLLSSSLGTHVVAAQTVMFSTTVQLVCVCVCVDGWMDVCESSQNTRKPGIEAQW